MGAEIDLRSHINGEIYLAHDANQNGPLLKDWLKEFKHKTLVINVKEDGLEDIVIEILESMGIIDYFFLDQPFPTLLKFLRKGIPCAVRISEYEVIPNKLNEHIKRIWLASFTGDWGHLPKAAEFADLIGAELCLVSPELQGRDFIDEIVSIHSSLKQSLLHTEFSVCTKYPEIWNRSE